jgi:hypothetical protein
MPDELISEAEWPISFWKTFYSSRLSFDFLGLVFGENFGFCGFRHERVMTGF